MSLGTGYHTLSPKPFKDEEIAQCGVIFLVTVLYSVRKPNCYISRISRGYGPFQILHEFLLRFPFRVWILSGVDKGIYLKRLTDVAQKT